MVETAAEANRQARITFRRMLRAQFDEDRRLAKCLARLYRLWRKIANRAEDLIGPDGEDVLVELDSNEAIERRSIGNLIRAARLYDYSCPEYGSVEFGAAMSWEMAGDSLHDAYKLLEIGVGLQLAAKDLEDAEKLEEKAKELESDPDFEFDEDIPPPDNEPFPAPDLPSIPPNVCQLELFFMDLDDLIKRGRRKENRKT